MAKQLRYDSPQDLAEKIIEKLTREELRATTKTLILYVNATLPQVQESPKLVKKNEKPSQEPEAKMWLYKARKGWVLANINNIPMDKAVSRLQAHYGCEILATKPEKVNFLPASPSTIDDLLSTGKFVYREDLNKKAA
jgi:3'-phosphoadenosine 5'-phosphosulfate sulfotransferase